MSLSQEGAIKEFSNYGTFDDTISQSIQVIISMMQYLEMAASRITGVPPQRIGAVQKNELVGNTEIVINQSTLTTKPLFSLHGDLVREMLSDVLNSARISWADSPKKDLVLGHPYSEVFTMDTQMFSETDYDIVLSDSGVEIKQIEELKQMANAMIQSQMIDVESAIDIVTLDSVTEIKRKIQENLQNKNQEQIQKLQQQNEEMDKQLKDLMNKLNIEMSKDKDLKTRELDLEEKKNNKDFEIKDKEVTSKMATDREKLSLEKDRVNLESLQLTFSNSSQEVRNK